MGFGIFGAGAVAQVHAKLKHGETIFEHVFPKPGCIFSVELCFGGQVVHYHNPHNTVGI
jgi:hypothetical protein